MPTLFPPEEVLRSGCDRCREEVAFAFTFAFQPIVDVAQREVFGYEALVRGPQGEPAMTVLGRVDDTNRYAFDQACRVRAITLASRLGLDRHLSINFLPNAVYEPSLCIRSTLEAAKECGFPAEKILFEVTEGSASTRSSISRTSSPITVRAVSSPRSMISARVIRG